MCHSTTFLICTVHPLMIKKNLFHIDQQRAPQHCVSRENQTSAKSKSSEWNSHIYLCSRLFLPLTTCPLKLTKTCVANGSFSNDTSATKAVITPATPLCPCNSALSSVLDFASLPDGIISLTYVCIHNWLYWAKWDKLHSDTTLYTVDAVETILVNVCWCFLDRNQIHTWSCIKWNNWCKEGCK